MDAIVASAGATHPLPICLDALKPGGRLLLPLTAQNRGGVVLLATRQRSGAFAARLILRVQFIKFIGLRDAAAQLRLKRALKREDIAAVASLRRDAHAEEEACWLHADGFCLSTRAA